MDGDADVIKSCDRLEQAIIDPVASSSTMSDSFPPLPASASLRKEEMGDSFSTLQNSQPRISKELLLSNIKTPSICERETQQEQEQYHPVCNSVADKSEMPHFQNFGFTFMEVISIASHNPGTGTEESESSAILAAEEEQDYPPPSISELVLRSRWPLIRKRNQLLLITVLTTLITCTCVYYAYNASITSEPLVDLLWTSSDTTIVTVNVLAQLSILFLTELTVQVCEN
jgi:hypothetical protein